MINCRLIVLKITNHFRFQISHLGKGLSLSYKEALHIVRGDGVSLLDYLVNRMKEFKILISSDGSDKNVIKIKPPLVFTKENAKELIFRLKSVFREDFMKSY